MPDSEEFVYPYSRDSLNKQFDDIIEDLFGNSPNVSLLLKHSNIPQIINILLTNHPILSSSMADKIIKVLLGLCKLFVNQSKQNVEKYKGWHWATSTLSSCMSLSNYSPQDKLLEELGISSKSRKKSKEQEYCFLIHSHIKSLQNSNIKFDEIMDSALALLLNLHKVSDEVSSEVIEELLYFCGHCDSHSLFPYFVHFVSSSPLYPNQIPDEILSKIWSFSLPLFQNQVRSSTFFVFFLL